MNNLRYCLNCGGSGRVCLSHASDPVDLRLYARCAICHGTGKVNNEGIPGAVAAVNKAPHCCMCDGEGTLDGYKACPVCKGVCHPGWWDEARAQRTRAQAGDTKYTTLNYRVQSSAADKAAYNHAAVPSDPRYPQPPVASLAQLQGATALWSPTRGLRISRSTERLQQCWVNEANGVTEWRNVPFEGDGYGG